MLNIIKGFLPWILFSIFYSNNSEQFMLAVIIALVCSIIFEWNDIKKGFILTWTSLIYFCTLLILTKIFQWHWLQINIFVVSNSVLTVMAFGSALIKKPFTIQYAKKEAPERFWKSPLFMQINVILTNIWGVIFLFHTAINFFHTDDPKIHGVLYFILTNIGWPIGAYISKKFPSYWKNYKGLKNDDFAI